MSPPNTRDEGSCWEAAVAVDDVDAGDDKITSTAAVDILGRVGDETRGELLLGL